jgi:hypothetical protein
MESEKATVVIIFLPYTQDLKGHTWNVGWPDGSCWDCRRPSFRCRLVILVLASVILLIYDQPSISGHDFSNLSPSMASKLLRTTLPDESPS